MRGRNISHVKGNIKKAINNVEKWSYEWGFKMSTSKSCYMVVTNKRKNDIERLTLYGHPLERAYNHQTLQEKI